jgi:uncharacterized DUF497 family protein
MTSTWDEARRLANLAKYGLDFAQAEYIFEGVTFSFEDERFEAGKDRFVTIGMLGSTVVVIAHTEQEDVVRIISMRRATGNEQRLYYRAFDEGWGEE